VAVYSDSDRLSLALAAAKLGDWSWDADSDVVTCSDRAAAIFQIPSGSPMTWTGMWELLHPDDAGRARAAVERALATHTDFDVEYRLTNGTGERWVLARGRGLYSETGRVLGMLGVVQDIDESVRTREALRQHADAAGASEERYRAFIDNSSEGIWRLEFTPPIDTSLPVDEQVQLAYANGRLAECNLAMARMYGLDSPEEIVGATLDTMLPASDPEARAYLASIIEAGYRVSDVESKERDVHGNVKYFSNSMSGVVRDGCLHRMWGSQRDISDRKRAGRAQAFLAAIVDSADDAIIAKDLDGVIQSSNAATERIFGYTADELVGRPVRILIPADRQSEEDDILARLRRGDRVDHFETVRLRKDGREIHVSLTVSPVRDDAGRIIGASKIARDITAQRQAAAEIAAQQAWFRITLASIGDAVIATDPRGHVTFMNATAERLTGWRTEDAIDQPLHEVFNIVNEKTRLPVENPGTLVMKLGHMVGLANHTVVIARDGTEHPIADSAAPIRDANDRMLGVVVVFRDVTDERRAEDALAQQREWLETTLESIGDAVVATDVQGRVVFMNRVAEHLTGWHVDQARDRSVYDVFRVVDEQSRQRVDDFVGRVISEGNVVRFGQSSVLVARDGTERTIDHSGAPIRNREGRLTGIVLVFKDVSERRRIELERQGAAAERDRLLDAERAARADAERASRVKDEFVGMVSHELRTPLNAILGWTQLMMSGKRDPAMIERGLEIVARNTRLQAQLISDLLDISRIVSGKLQVDVQAVDLRAVARDAIETVRHDAAAKDIRIELHDDHSTGTIAADPARLQQVIWNLLSNAIKFTGRGGRIDVTLHHHDGHAELTVSDTGAGIRADVLPYVFDLFHQADRSITRRFGGLGLGLAIVKHLMELHGGTVSAESPGEGKGATFRIALPIGIPIPSEAANLPEPAEMPYPAVSLEALRVLVVEDEQDSQDFLRRLLESHGAKVSVAASAREALDAIRERLPQILISDIGLPDMDGYELMRVIRGDDQQQLSVLPAIALTAYARAEDRARAFRAGYQAHLTKPVEPGELVMTIANFAGMVRAHSGR
jgi:PAS domain S-box-containing protein